MIAFLLLTLPSPVTVDVDVIELNHVYSLQENRDEWGRMHSTANYVASYYLLWSWYPEGLHIRDWVKADARCTLDRDTLTVVAKRVIQIRGKVVRERSTPFDAEREDQLEYPVGRRRVIEGLRR